MADLTRFVAMLQRLEAVTGNWLTEWESNFVKDMREKYDSREDAIDLGMTAWIPTKNQYNTLHGIWSKL